MPIRRINLSGNVAKRCVTWVPPSEFPPSCSEGTDCSKRQKRRAKEQTGLSCVRDGVRANLLFSDSREDGQPLAAAEGVLAVTWSVAGARGEGPPGQGLRKPAERLKAAPSRSVLVFYGCWGTSGMTEGAVET